jgi:hypothetical protein
MEINDLRRVACAPDRPEQDRRRFATAPFAADLIFQISKNKALHALNTTNIPHVFGTANGILILWHLALSFGLKRVTLNGGDIVRQWARCRLTSPRRRRKNLNLTLLEASFQT